MAFRTSGRNTTKTSHLALLSACNSRLLLDFCNQLHGRTYRYRNLAEVIKYRERHELEEHPQLHDAVLAKDAEKAVELLHRHYTVTVEILRETGRFE